MMIEELTVPQIEHYYGKTTAPDGEELTITVNIEGSFPPITESQAQPAPGEENEAQPEQLVAWFIWWQLLDWHKLLGTWLVAGDEVEHYNGPGNFTIVRRAFTRGFGRSIDYTVKFRRTE